jgi:hypothetical protein
MGMSIDDKAEPDPLTQSKRMNRVALCHKSGIFYNPDKRSCDILYPCEFRVETAHGAYKYYTCKKHNPELNSQAKQV